MLQLRTRDGNWERVTWKWRGPSDRADFGDPLGTDAYTLCVYDAHGVVLDATAPAGGLCRNDRPCWTAKPQGFLYKDRDRTPDGLATLKLASSQIAVIGRGPELGTGTLAGLASPLTVQLHGPDECWSATYSFPPALRYDARQFKDRAD